VGVPHLLPAYQAPVAPLLPSCALVVVGWLGRVVDVGADRHYQCGRAFDAASKACKKDSQALFFSILLFSKIRNIYFHVLFDPKWIFSVSNTFEIYFNPLGFI
jgi:hypothetical protein